MNDPICRFKTSLTGCTEPKFLVNDGQDLVYACQNHYHELCRNFGPNNIKEYQQRQLGISELLPIFQSIVRNLQEEKNNYDRLKIEILKSTYDIVDKNSIANEEWLTYFTQWQEYLSNRTQIEEIEIKQVNSLLDLDTGILGIKVIYEKFFENLSNKLNLPKMPISLPEKNDSLQKELTLLKEENNKLSAALNLAQAKNDSFQKELTLLREENNKLSVALNLAQSNNDSFQKELTLLKEENNKLSVAPNFAEEKIKNFESPNSKPNTYQIQKPDEIYRPTPKIVSSPPKSPAPTSKKEESVIVGDHIPSPFMGREITRTIQLIRK